MLHEEERQKGVFVWGAGRKCAAGGDEAHNEYNQCKKCPDQ